MVIALAEEIRPTTVGNRREMSDGDEEKVEPTTLSQGCEQEGGSGHA
jgi:hypothetical protein